jgi:cytochrome c peroxidase
VASYASRSATKKYRTAPLAGLWQHAPYFHNGSAATLDDVVEIYNTRKALGLTPDQKTDLVQYLKSL